MPAMAVSTLALISAVLTRVSLKALFIMVLVLKAKKIINGSTAKVISVSGKLICASMIKAPIKIISDRNRFSGPWWASSDTSNKSLIIRLMMTPVLFSSKNENGSFCR